MLGGDGRCGGRCEMLRGMGDVGGYGRCWGEMGDVVARSDMLEGGGRFWGEMGDVGGDIRGQLRGEMLIVGARWEMLGRGGRCWGEVGDVGVFFGNCFIFRELSHVI